MHQLLSISFALLAVCSCTYGDSVRLKSIDVGPAHSNANLVANSGFETLDAKGFPDGWTWDKRNTDALCGVDNRGACGGLRSLRVSNSTPLESPYTGQLWTTNAIGVEPGRTYTVSAWTKSDDPGLASICTGGGWPYRIMLPPTGGEWELVATTFLAGQADKGTRIYLQTESPTRAFWLDNVKLEEGDYATFADPPSGAGASPHIWAQNRERELLEEGEFIAPFVVWVPRAVRAELEASMSGQKPSVSRQIDLSPGMTQVMVKGVSDAASYTPRTVTLRLTGDGKELASARTTLRFYSREYAEARLDETAKRLPVLKEKIGKLKASGQDVSYPMVSYTVLENFVGYAKEDAAKGEVKRAVDQLSDLDSMEKSLNKEIAGAASGKAKLPAVPRWTAQSRPVVQGSSFISTTATPGKPGVETGPVFFTGYGHFSQVRNDLEKFGSYGINIIQIEIGPWAVMPTEGTVDDKPARGMLELLDRAQKAGVAVNLLLSPHYVPQWVKEKIKNSLGYDHYCLRSPEMTALMQRHISTVVGLIKDHPALHSICLSNESTYSGDRCELAVRDWHAWLKARHGDIGTLNSRWGTSYAGFDDVKLPYVETDPRTPIGRWVDCVRWNQEFHAGWHKMLSDMVHAIAPNLPTHAKVQTPTLLGYTDVGSGNDAYLFGQATDINGNDNINWPSFGCGEFAQSWMSNARGYDLQRSVSDAPVFNSENHIIGDRDTRHIPSDDVRAALWQQAIHGQSATTIWVWERTFDRSHDFAGSIMHRPACAEAVGIVNHDLNRAAKEVTALQQAPPQVMILHDTTAMVYDGESYDGCMKKLYMALGFCGVRIGFITERQLEAGIVPGAAVVFVPNAKRLSDAAFETLAKYKGRLVMVGEGLLTRNEYDAERPARLSCGTIAYAGGATSADDLWKALLPALQAWSVAPLVQLVDGKGQPVWGVEWREASADNTNIVNMCNYLNVSVSVRLSQRGKGVRAVDVLTGQRVGGELRLRPLEVRLLRVEPAAK